MQEQVKLVIAETIDHQKIEFLIFNNQIIGSGGFGVVKKAVCNDRPDQQLVVKIIPYKDEKEREKIQKEINVIRKLPRHPNLVRVQPLKCYSTNNYYIFMDYCPDGTLEDLRKRKKNIFTENEIFDIFYQLMNGYKILWKSKILHQDLKPDNVLVKDGKFKLTDFGFSIFYENFKYGNKRQGTLYYMSPEKLQEKQYYASTKSDVYSMGIILFKLITGYHPYVQKSINEYRPFLIELRSNKLYLRPNIFNHFSIKFQHLFELVLKMIDKNQSTRIDFDAIYQYIENQQIFDEARMKVNTNQKPIQAKQANRIMITGQSEAIAVHFGVSETQQHQFQDFKEMEAKNRQSLEKQKIIKEIEQYIVSQRIIVYYFDRLTRRIYIEKLKNNASISSSESVLREKLIFGLFLFCRKLIQNLLKQCKNGSIYSKNSWKLYRKANTNILDMIQRDESYLKDLVIDCLSQSSQTKIKERKQLLDKVSKDLKGFKQIIFELLESFLKVKSSIIKPDDKQNLITICYIKHGMEILANYQKWETDAFELQNYFRETETEDAEVLFKKITDTFLKQDIHFTLNLGDGE